MKLTANRFLLVCALALVSVMPAGAQFGNFDLGRAAKGAITAAKAIKLSDKDVAEYVHQSVVQMDASNKVMGAKSKYVIRLNKLTANLKEVEGIPLNFKVYDVDDVNAFACADGSVRVFRGLMDLMDDEELLGVIGHEVGHVAKKHSKNAFKTALLASAAKDAVGSTGGLAARLTDSQLGELSETLLNAKYSQKQENEADDYGYEFLKSHGVNPQAMIKAFTKLQSLEQQSGSSSKVGSYFQKMFSSHPETSKRIERMTKRCKKDGFIK